MTNLQEGISDEGENDHGGPTGDDPHYHDSKPKPSEGTSTRDTDGSVHNPLAGSQCRKCAVAADRCAALLDKSLKRYGGWRYCTALKAGEIYSEYPDDDRCPQHQPDDI